MFRNLSYAWQQGLMLIMELPIGIAYFTIVVTGISLSAGLIPIFIGVPLFLVIMNIAGSVYRYERSRAYIALGHTPPLDTSVPTRQLGFIDKLKASLTRSDHWLGLIVMFAKLPLGIAAFVFVIIFFCISIGFLAYPFVYIILSQTIFVDIYHTGLTGLLPFEMDPLIASIIYVLIGMALLYYTAPILRGFSYLYYGVHAMISFLEFPVEQRREVS